MFKYFEGCVKGAIHVRSRFQCASLNVNASPSPYLTHIQPPANTHLPHLPCPQRPNPSNQSSRRNFVEELMSPLTISLVTLPAFLSTLSRYSSSVPEKLRELDKARYETIPAALAERREDAKGGEGVGLEKEEVVGLVEWKLYVSTSDPSKNRSRYIYICPPRFQELWI